MAFVVVKQSYRLCLVYNVTLAKSRSKKGITAPTNSAAITELRGVLDAWRKERKEEELAVTLEHQYTQDGLKLDTLKGVDRSRADTLSRRLTLERWYYRAAVVIWPRERHFLVLCGAGTDASVGGLQALVSQWKRAAKSCRDQQRQACCEFAAAIIESWQPSHNWRAGIDGSVAGIWPARYLSDQRSPSRDR